MRVAAIGERSRVAAWAAAGVVVLPARGPEAVRAAWRGLAADVGLVILTPAAAAVLGPPEGGPLTAVMPPQDGPPTPVAAREEESPSSVTASGDGPPTAVTPP
ncbi:hypothetical protein [Streptomyces sp. NPDC047000]|uniref:hypothetical protein n=1 Tax=Streptomyces sp. NPDC047000 TaxID=3155474 RepID=UPI0033F3C430